MVFVFEIEPPKNGITPLGQSLLSFQNRQKTVLSDPNNMLGCRKIRPWFGKQYALAIKGHCKALRLVATLAKLRVLSIGYSPIAVKRCWQIKHLLRWGRTGRK